MRDEKQDLIRQNQNKTMGIDDVWEFKEGVSRFITSHMAMLLGNFCIMLLFAFMAQVFIVRNKL